VPIVKQKPFAVEKREIYKKGEAPALLFCNFAPAALFVFF
jgi:hypothetical protein